MEALQLVRSGHPLPILKYVTLALYQVMPDDNAETAAKRIRLLPTPVGVFVKEEPDSIIIRYEGKVVSTITFPNHPHFNQFDELHTIHYPTAGS